MGKIPNKKSAPTSTARAQSIRSSLAPERPSRWETLATSETERTLSANCTYRYLDVRKTCQLNKRPPLSTLMTAEDTGTRAKKDKAVSCLECRRLKLKCDRIFPCSSCRKRGVAHLCPNAALPTRPRLQLAEAARSNATFTQMAARKRELEVALAALQAEHSNQPHPLLANKKTDDDELNSSESKQSICAITDEYADLPEETLGTLTIDESGKSRFFGQSAGMESLYHNDLDAELAPADVPVGPFDPLTDHILDPLYDKVDKQAILQHLECYLPGPVRAWELCDIYYSNLSWLWTIIPREQFEKDILLPVYASSEAPSFPATTNAHLSAAMLFMVFALGSLLDLDSPTEIGEYSSEHQPKQMPCYSSGADDGLLSQTLMASESERYHALARAALTAGQSIIQEPSIPGIQIVFLMTIWHMVLDRRTALQMMWSHVSIAMGLVSSMGLHRESVRWNLDEETAERRRTLFWELYGFTSLMVGLAFGRPPPISRMYVDCALGKDPCEMVWQDVSIERGHHYRVRLMSSSILPEICDLILNATAPKYKEIVAFDHKLRDCALKIFGSHVGARDVGPDVMKEPTTTATMRRFQVLFYKEWLILYLHRKYFVRACTLRPEVLPNSAYCLSLLAAFRSAEVVILLMDSLTILQPELCRRFAHYWNHTLASAIMVASIAIRHPCCALAGDAMKSLETVLGLLQRSAHKSDRLDRPTKALKTVRKLYEKACQAMSQPPDQDTDSEASRPTDELGILGGHTRVFVSKRTSATCSREPGDLPQEHRPLPEEIHMSLKDDLCMMNQGQLLGTTFRPQGPGVDLGNICATMSYPPTQIASTYTPPHFQQNMYSYPQEGGSYGGHETQASHYPPDFGYQEPFIGVGVGELPPESHMPPTTGIWGSTEEEISWQGFVAGLNV